MFHWWLQPHPWRVSKTYKASFFTVRGNVWLKLSAMFLLEILWGLHGYQQACFSLLCLEEQDSPEWLNQQKNIVWYSDLKHITVTTHLYVAKSPLWSFLFDISFLLPITLEVKITACSFSLSEAYTNHHGASFHQPLSTLQSKQNNKMIIILKG